MKNNYTLYTACLLFAISIAACKHEETNTNTTTAKNSTVTTTSCNVNEYLVGAILYQQQSGEYRALAYQAFSLAKLRLDEALHKKGKKDTLVVITDLDETMLDNSAYDAHIVMRNITDRDGSEWKRWVAMKNAKALPGAIDFVKYADSKGVQLYYITNRSADGLDATMDNMQSLGFPQVASSHFMMNTGNSNKQARFDSVMHHSGYKVVLQLGDNLNDFSGDYYGKNDGDRKNVVDAMANKFGTYYITLPNACYGAWMDVLYGSADTTNDLKYQKRHNSLSGY